ncbi:MAG: hypothetical protein IPH09_12825 [bacterium]|nr:hypothetical protein [bacterium]
MAGEQMPMCGMCTPFGSIMMSGAQMEQILIEGGVLMVTSSQDPKTVAMIRKHGQRNIDESTPR